MTNLIEIIQMFYPWHLTDIKHINFSLLSIRFYMYTIKRWFKTINSIYHVIDTQE